MRLLVVLFCVLSAVSGLRLDAPEHAAKAKPAADAPAPKAAPVADRATALGIAPDVQRDVTAASCETCLKLFFKIAKSPHSSLSFLKNKCPEQHTPEAAETCRRIVHSQQMNGVRPGIDTCTSIGACNGAAVQALKKNGELIKIESLVGYGEKRVGTVGLWGEYGHPHKKATGSFDHCIEECEKTTQQAVFQFNLLGLHGLTKFRDNVCAAKKVAHERDACMLGVGFVQLNGATSDVKAICEDIGVCDFLMVRQPVVATDETTVVRDAKPSDADLVAPAAEKKAAKAEKKAEKKAVESNRK